MEEHIAKQSSFSLTQRAITLHGGITLDMIFT